MPDPKAEVLGMRPSKRYEGVYFFIREPFDDQVKVIEPGGDASYILPYFPFEVYLRRILKCPDVQRVTDYLWSFHRMAYDTRTDRFWRVGKDGEFKGTKGPYEIYTSRSGT